VGGIILEKLKKIKIYLQDLARLLPKINPDLLNAISKMASAMEM